MELKKTALKKKGIKSNESRIFPQKKDNSRE